MSQKIPPKGRLFENRDKRKPSQPDMQGEGRIDGKPYAIQAWIRENQLVLSFSPPRDGTNSYPPEEFRGALDPAPERRRGGDDGPAPTWTGDIAGDEGAFDVRAFEKQGKSGQYLDLVLQPAAAPASSDV
ncbi:MAG: hypothetical protein JRH11_13825 [Deltaproteobacteria bacterium]|nr:hypothetical protein [Deltaproteobacteria bacterium]